MSGFQVGFLVLQDAWSGAVSSANPYTHHLSRAAVAQLLSNLSIQTQLNAVEHFVEQLPIAASVRLIDVLAALYRTPALKLTYSWHQPQPLSLKSPDGSTEISGAALSPSAREARTWSAMNGGGDLTYCHVRIACAPQTTSRDVRVTLAAQRVRVDIAHIDSATSSSTLTYSPVLFGTLFDSIDVDASDWELVHAPAPGGCSFIQLNLKRLRPCWWPRLLSASQLDAHDVPCSDTLRSSVALQFAAQSAVEATSASRELHWLQLAADSDNDHRADEYKQASTQAAHKLAEIYFTGQHPALAGPDYVMYIHYLQQSVDGGMPDSALKLALHYEKGEYVPPNYTLAEKYYRIAAQHKIHQAVALFHLGCLLHSGHLSKVDTNAAEQCWQQSARDGYGPSYFQLGMLQLKQNHNKAALTMFENAVRCDPLLEPRVLALGILSAEHKTPLPQSTASNEVTSQHRKLSKSNPRWMWSVLSIAAVAAGAMTLWWLNRRVAPHSVAAVDVAAPSVQTATKRVEPVSVSHEVHEMEALAHELGLIDK